MLSVLEQSPAALSWQSRRTTNSMALTTRAIGPRSMVQQTRVSYSKAAVVFAGGAAYPAVQHCQRDSLSAQRRF